MEEAEYGSRGTLSQGRRACVRALIFSSWVSFKVAEV